MTSEGDNRGALGCEMTYILMASIRKDYHGQATKEGYGTVPSDVADLSPVFHRVRGKVVDNEDDQVSDGDERNNARVLE